MTDIAFHFNAPDKLGYACRLLRKATASGSKVIVTGDADVLARLDVLLWSFSALEFIPHCFLPSASSAMLARTAVVLSPRLESLPHTDVLVNLGDEIPEGFEPFARLIEVVTQADEDRQMARQRWKQYAGRGFTIVRHDLAPVAH